MPEDQDPTTKPRRKAKVKAKASPFTPSATAKIQDTPPAPRIAWVDFCGDCGAQRQWLTKLPFGEPDNPRGHIQCGKCGKLVNKELVNKGE